jgi:hypothetical protein
VKFILSGRAFARKINEIALMIINKSFLVLCVSGLALSQAFSSPSRSEAAGSRKEGPVIRTIYTPEEKKAIQANHVVCEDIVHRKIAEVEAARHRKVEPVRVAPARVEPVRMEPARMEPVRVAPAPVVVVAPTRESRLAELLRRYHAEEITPREYHEQRAKIISESR